jgi:hypothetical protein
MTLGEPWKQSKASFLYDSESVSGALELMQNLEISYVVAPST